MSDEAPADRHDPEQASRAARQLVLGAGLVALGLALAGTLDRSIGGVVIIAGWAFSLMGLHRFGRSGPG